jgi:predicted transglutaminase-like cysteine proteinase
MRVGRVFLVTLMFASGCVQAARGNPMATTGQDTNSSMMRVFGPTDPPYAFWRFCEEFALDCRRGQGVDARFETSIEDYEALSDINYTVNHTIEPVTDLEHYGVSDYWTLPKNDKGDCEDYALLKRHQLIAAGWPASALLITVVRDEKMEGHAVLTARTSKGDFILDNKTDEIRLWNRTPYKYVMRQSYLDPRAWVALDPAQSAPPVSIAVFNRPN